MIAYYKGTVFDGFNGAAIIRSRKWISRRKTGFSIFALQWGRDHSIAEILRPSKKLLITLPRFNGAAIIRSRKSTTSPIPMW